MRNRMFAVAVMVAVAANSGRAQDTIPQLAELPPSGADPLNSRFFQPNATNDPTARGTRGTLFDAAMASDPFLPAPAYRENILCECDPDFTTMFSVELLIGRTRAPSIVPVVTTGPATAGVTAASIGAPGTVPLFGGRRMLNDWRTGLRLEYGVWFNDGRRTGVSARFYSLFSTSEQFNLIPNNTAVVNLPQAVAIGNATVQIPAFASFPGVTTGSVATTAQTTFTGGDFNFRHSFGAAETSRVDLLLGYRQLHLGDEIGATFNLQPVGVDPSVAPRLAGDDSVRTRNNFYGPQIGFYATTGGDRFWVEFHGSTAVGITASDLNFSRLRAVGVGVNANGTPANPLAVLTALGAQLNATNLAIATATSQIPLVQTDTVGRITYFGLVGEGGARFNWQAGENLRVTAGYSFLYWNNVRRAQEMFVLGPALRPRAIDFTLHTFSFGLDVRF